MNNNSAPHSAYPHGEIEELFPNIFMVTGSMRMAKPKLTFSRNMTIIREGDELILINSVRLDERGLKQLNALGKVSHVVRLAAFHGIDDPFYQQRYQAKVWSVDAPYSRGLAHPPEPEDVYFQADEIIKPTSKLPISGARLLEITSATPSEGLMYLERNDGIVISGDCLQNWQKADKYFSFMARIMMKLMGFLKPYNIGPGWLKYAKPDIAELRSLLDVDFNAVIPAHGEPVMENAKPSFFATLKKLAP